jgi:glucose-6-phosphate isomerase
MLKLYWKNATEKGLKSGRHGITEAELRGIAGRLVKAHGKVARQCRTGKLGYAKLPTHKTYAADVLKLVRRYKAGTTDLVVLGIGGSALGSIALQAALNPRTYNLLSKAKRGGPRLFVLDNVDPAMVKETLDFLGPRLKTTLVNVISKGGDTAETVGQFMILREMLRERLGRRFNRRIVVTTDRKKGTLRNVAGREGYPRLIVPDDVGGRFSVLSHVGLFSAAMCGIDIRELLAGAACMQQRVQRAVRPDSWRENPACVLAAIKYLAFKKKRKPIHVMMPYSNRLYLLADWYRQLWAESLGKRLSRSKRVVSVGPTPIRALGATDQHSQVQLYREGPNDKLFVFLEVTTHPREVTIPDVFARVPGLTYLRGADLGELLNTEKLATEYALAVSKRPSVTIRFDKITPHSVGAFLYLYEFTTSLMGELLNINAYDEPAVKLVKRATFALMGRKGYEQMARRIRSFLREDEAYLA